MNVKKRTSTTLPQRKDCCGRTLLKPQVICVSPALNAKKILFSFVIAQYLYRKEGVFLYLGKEHVKKNHNNTDSVSEIQSKKKRRRQSTGKKRSGKPGHGSHVADNRKSDYYSFTCCRCHHVCRRGDTGEIVWATCELISTKGNTVAQAVCPGCMIKLIQCCKCSHNINPKDPETIAACGKERGFPSGLMK